MTFSGQLPLYGPQNISRVVLRHLLFRDLSYFRRSDKCSYQHPRSLFSSSHHRTFLHRDKRTSFLRFHSLSRLPFWSFIMASDNIHALIGIHTMGYFFVCIGCKSGLPSKRRVSDHLCNPHGMDPASAKTLSAKVWEKRESLRSTMPMSTLANQYVSMITNASSDMSGSAAIPDMSRSPATTSSKCSKFLAPLRGITVTYGYKCCYCSSCYTDIRTLSAHISQLHSPQDPEGAIRDIQTRGKIRLQTIFGGRARTLFPVSVMEPVGEIINVFGKKTKTIEEGSQTDGEQSCATTTRDQELTTAASKIMESILLTKDETGSSHVDRKLKNTFVFLSRVDEVLHARNLSHSQAAALSGPKLVDDNVWDLVLADVTQYVLMIPTLTMDLPNCVLKTVNIRSRGEKQFEFRSVSSKTGKNYANEICRLVMFCIRCLPNHNHLCETDIPGLLNLYLEELKNVHQSGTLSMSNGTSPEGNSFQKRYETIHLLLKSLFLQSRPLFARSTSFTIKNFFCSRCVRPETLSPHPTSFRFCEAWEVSGPLAALQYGISACAVHEINMAQEKSPHSYAGFIPEDLDSEMKRISDALDLTKNNTASYVRSMLDIAMGIIDQEEINVTFESCETHASCGIVKNIHLSLIDLGLRVVHCHRKIEHLIFETLLLSSQLPDGFMSMLHSLQDNMNIRIPGYNFMSFNHRQESWVTKNIYFVLKALSSSSGAVSLSECKTPPGSNQPIPNQENLLDLCGVPVFRSKVLDWVETCREVQDLLLFCIHVSSGSPARATEIATLRLTNDSLGLRSFFISQGEAMIVSRWVKTKGIKGFGKPIPRFPDPKTSELLLMYLTLIRPLETAMVARLYGESRGKSHWGFFFCHNGKQITEEQVRNSISKRLFIDGVQLNFNDYRNFTVGMVTKVSGDKALSVIEQIRNECESVAHIQAGHSVETAARVYARTKEELGKLDKSSLSANRTWSSQWHRSLLLDTTVSRSAGEKDMLEHDYPRKKMKIGNIIACRCCTVPAIDTSILQKKADKEHECKNLSPSVLQQSQKDAFVMDSDIALSYGMEHRRDAFAERGSTILSGVRMFEGTTRTFEHMLQHFLRQLRCMLSDNEATFRSMMQFSTTASVSERRENMLVVMPTGSGKSFCFFLPVFMERNSFSTILIVPLLSLVREMKLRAEACGIRASSTISQNSDNFFDLYILLPEQVREQPFKRLVNSLLTNRRLARVVIDEAHLTSSWSSFRQSLRDLRYGLLEVPSHIPRLLFTATIPPRNRALLLSKHGLSSATVFSMPTVRKNLAFSVICPSLQAEQTRSRTGKYQNDKNKLETFAITFLDKKLDELCIDSPNCNFFRAMVFVMQRNEVERLSDILSTAYDPEVGIWKKQFSAGTTKYVSVLSYHAGMTRETRNRMYNSWRNPKTVPEATKAGKSACHVSLMICTCAFGAGLDAPDVRLVLHIGGSTSVQDYAQEAGRAGRDEKKANCVTVYSPDFGEFMERRLEEKALETSLAEDFEKVEMWREQKKWLESSTRCRKNWLYGAMDGQEPGICLLDRDSENCDVCRRASDTVGREGSSPGERLPQFELQSPSQEVQRPTLASSGLMADRSTTFKTAAIVRDSRPVRSPIIENNMQSVLDVCEGLCKKFQGICLACFIAFDQVVGLEDAVTHEKHVCAWKQRRCFRCFSSHHRYSACPNNLHIPQGGCFKCGLSYSRGFKVHREGLGFASTCKIVLMKDLGWFLWRKSEEMRKRMVNDLFSDDEYKTIHGSQGSSMQSNQSSFDKKDAFFANWLSSTDNETPGLLLLGMWYKKMTT